MCVEIFTSSATTRRLTKHWVNEQLTIPQAPMHWKDGAAQILLLRVANAQHAQPDDSFVSQKWRAI